MKQEIKDKNREVRGANRANTSDNNNNSSEANKSAYLSCLRSKSIVDPFVSTGGHVEFVPQVETTIVDRNNKRKAIISREKHPKTLPDSNNEPKEAEDDTAIIGAGLQYGRRATVRTACMLLMLRSRFAHADHDDPDRHHGQNERFASVIHVRNGSRSVSTATGYSITDSGADTCCVGDGFHILSYTGRTVNLRGYDDGGDLQADIKVCTAATAWEDHDGTVLILVFNEALDLG